MLQTDRAAVSNVLEMGAGGGGGGGGLKRFKFKKKKRKKDQNAPKNTGTKHSANPGGV